MSVLLVKPVGGGGKKYKHFHKKRGENSNSSHNAYKGKKSPTKINDPFLILFPLLYYTFFCAPSMRSTSARLFSGKFEASWNKPNKAPRNRQMYFAPFMCSIVDSAPILRLFLGGGGDKKLLDNVFSTFSTFPKEERSPFQFIGTYLINTLLGLPVDFS